MAFAGHGELVASRLTSQGLAGRACGTLHLSGARNIPPRRTMPTRTANHTESIQHMHKPRILTKASHGFSTAFVLKASGCQERSTQRPLKGWEPHGMSGSHQIRELCSSGWRTFTLNAAPRMLQSAAASPMKIKIGLGI